MTPKKKAISLVDSYRIILMNEDTECGNEILCTVIAKKCALVAVNEMIDIRNGLYINEGSIAHKWLLDVKHEIEKL
jgi:hypothetical protein